MTDKPTKTDIAAAQRVAIELRRQVAGGFHAVSLPEAKNIVLGELMAAKARAVAGNRHKE